MQVSSLKQTLRFAVLAPEITPLIIIHIPISLTFNIHIKSFFNRAINLQTAPIFLFNTQIIPSINYSKSFKNQPTIRIQI